MQTPSPHTSPAASAEKPVSKTGTITGLVQYAIGDGPLQAFPEGPVQLEVSADSTIVTWMHEGESNMTAIPKQDYDRYRTEGLIKVD